MGMAFLAIGVPIMLWWRSRDSAFFTRGIDPMDQRPDLDARDVIASIAEEVLGRGIATAIAAGLEARGELVAARPVDGLIAVADQVDTSMIVVGHQGEGPLRGALLGATANRLLHQAERPVLVVPATE